MHKPCSFFRIKLWGLDVQVVYDNVFGFAHLESKDAGLQDFKRLYLLGIHMSVKKNQTLNELLMEMYGEDLRFK